MAARDPSFRLKFPNEINSILLCMGLFSAFLMGRPS